MQEDRTHPQLEQSFKAWTLGTNNRISRQDIYEDLGTKRVEMTIPDVVLDWLGWRGEEVAQKINELLVLHLLRLHHISQGKAAELLNIDRHELFDLMTKYRVPVIDMTPEELQEELQRADAIFREKRP